MVKRVGLIAAVILGLGNGMAMAEPDAGTVLKEPTTGMEFVWVPSGCFYMGSESGERFEEPIHPVCVKGFWLGKDEVTQAQYQKITESNPSETKGAEHPVDSISWDDAVSFTMAYSLLTKVPMRLPSESEWEYACRAGGRHKTYCGDGDPAKLGWYGSNSGNGTSPVGKLHPNAWGLYDMSGNVWEWVQDCWNLDYVGAPMDGSGWLEGNCERRVARGGAYDINQPNMLRAAKRGRGDRNYRLNVVGFRVVIAPK